MYYFVNVAKNTAHTKPYKKEKTQRINSLC
jgi:hypothetical protein